MHDLVELVAEVPQDSLFFRSKIYQTLFLDSLLKQGFESCIILCGEKVLEFSHKLFLRPMTRKNFIDEQASFANRVLFVSIQNFVCLNLKRLLKESHDCTLGVCLAADNREYPFFDSDANLIGSNYFGNDWADAYQFSGGLACEKSLFFRAFSKSRSSKQLIERINEHCTPKSILVGGYTVRPQVEQKGFADLEDYLNKPIRPCLFLDRDGILNVDCGYPHKRSQFQPIEGIIPIIKWARSKSWWVVLVTNQAGLAKGVFRYDDYLNFTHYLHDWLNKYQLSLDSWQYCPYHPQGVEGPYRLKSLKRKPLPGMVLESMASLPIDLDQSLIIGDRESDILSICGLKALLIEGRYPLSQELSAPKVSGHEQALQFLLDHY